MAISVDFALGQTQCTTNALPLIICTANCFTDQHVALLQISEDLTLPLLRTGTQSNDIISLCDIIATEFEASKSCQTKDSSALK